MASRIYIKGLNALLATICTPLSAPVIAATRLRKGATNSVRGAAKLLADARVVARRAGATGLVIVRADSACYCPTHTIRTQLINVPARIARSAKRRPRPAAA